MSTIFFSHANKKKKRKTRLGIVHWNVDLTKLTRLPDILKSHCKHTKYLYRNFKTSILIGSFLWLYISYSLRMYSQSRWVEGFPTESTAQACWEALVIHLTEASNLPLVFRMQWHLFRNHSILYITQQLTILSLTGW